MICIYRCRTCDNEWKFDGHPMNWGRFMGQRKCCERRVYLYAWGFDLEKMHYAKLPNGAV